MTIESTALIIKIMEDSIRMQTATLDATIIIVQELDRQVHELLEKVEALETRLYSLENDHG